VFLWEELDLTTGISVGRERGEGLDLTTGISVGREQVRSEGFLQLWCAWDEGGLRFLTESTEGRRTRSCCLKT